MWTGRKYRNESAERTNILHQIQREVKALMKLVNNEGLMVLTAIEEKMWT